MNFPVANSAFFSACSSSGLRKPHKTSQWEIVGVQKHTQRQLMEFANILNRPISKIKFLQTTALLSNALLGFIKSFELWSITSLNNLLQFFLFFQPYEWVSQKEWHFQPFSLSHSLPCASNEMSFVRSKPPSLHPYSLPKSCTALSSMVSTLSLGWLYCGKIITRITLMWGVVCVSIGRANANLCIKVAY